MEAKTHLLWLPMWNCGNLGKWTLIYQASAAAAD